VLHLILSPDLNLCFLYPPDAATTFKPGPEHLGQPVESARLLIAADPGLPLDCRAAAKGVDVPPRRIGASAGEGYLRRIFVRAGPDAKPLDLIVTYEVGAMVARAELARVRSRLAGAIAAIPDPVAYFDDGGRLVLCNGAYGRLHGAEAHQHLTGLSFEEILQRTPRDQGNAQTPGPDERWINERIKVPHKPVFESEFRLDDGRWFREIDRATDDGGRVHVLLDVTGLKETTRRLEEVVEGARVGTWSLDPQSGAGTVNAYWAELLGLTHPELGQIGFEDWRALVHPDDVSNAEAGFLDCLSGKAERFDVEYRMRHRSGRWVWVLGRGGVSDRFADGRVRQIAGVLLDISSRKRLEAELTLRAAAVAATEDAVLITDASGTVLDANPAHARLFGIDDPGELVGASWLDFFDAEAAADLASRAFPELRAEGGWRGDVHAQRSNGAVFEQELSLTEMPEGEIVWVGRDVSKRKALAREQQALRDRVEVAQRQEVINLIAAGLTHDLGNLLAAVMHLSDPILAGHRRAEDVLQKVHGLSLQMVEMLVPLRDVGITGLGVEESNLGSLMCEAAQLVSLGAPDHHQIRTRLPEKALWSVLEPMRLTQVLLNLGLNARDALECQAGEICFSLSEADELPDGVEIVAGAVPEVRFALFTVSDTGPGIPDDVLARIWEPRFTTKGQRGTGLGLPLIATIVSEIGGGVAVRTRLGEGTTFYVCWPIREEDDSHPDMRPVVRSIYGGDDHFTPPSRSGENRAH